jgi:hypothetical protein
MKSVIAAGALVLSLACGTALAAPPVSREACLQQAFEIAAKTASMKMPAAKQAKIEGLLSEMESRCQAGDFAGADGRVRAIETEFAGN